MLLNVLRLAQRTQQLYFDPQTYVKSASLNPLLGVVDSFFVDTLGGRAANWNSDRTNGLPVTSHAAAILQKRTAQEVTPQELLFGLWNYLSNIRANHPDIWQQLVDFANSPQEAQESKNR